MVSSLTFESLIHCVYFFVFYKKVILFYFFYIYLSNILNTIYWKDCLYSILCSCLLCQIQWYLCTYPGLIPELLISAKTDKYQVMKHFALWGSMTHTSSNKCYMSWARAKSWNFFSCQNVMNTGFDEFRIRRVPR